MEQLDVVIAIVALLLGGGVGAKVMHAVMVQSLRASFVSKEDHKVATNSITTLEGKVSDLQRESVDLKMSINNLSLAQEHHAMRVTETLQKPLEGFMAEVRQFMQNFAGLASDLKHMREGLEEIKRRDQ